MIAIKMMLSVVRTAKTRPMERSHLEATDHECHRLEPAERDFGRGLGLYAHARHCKDVPPMMDLARFAQSALVALSLALTSCGGKALQTPEDLPITEYSVGDFTITLVMTTCSNVCSQYEEPQCDSSVEDSTITISVSVPYGDKDGADPTKCALTCGPKILAHCQVSGLGAGTYTVVAGNGFERSITIR